jgi:hypothetical protein
MFRGEKAGRQEQVANGSENSPVEIGKLACDFADDVAKRRLERPILLAAVGAELSSQDRATVVAGRRHWNGRHRRRCDEFTVVSIRLV